MSVSEDQAAGCRAVLAGQAQGPVIATREALSFWGGVDPATGRVIDVHHPLHGMCLSGAVLLMPTSRGSCSGSGVLLDLILNGQAPAAFVFSEAEDVLTLGALVAAEMFGMTVPVARLSAKVFDTLFQTEHLAMTGAAIRGDTQGLPLDFPLLPPLAATLDLTEDDRAMLAGREGPAAQQAMRIIFGMAAQQGARRLVDVTRGHIDGCIYASPANLTFAEAMEKAEARVRIPTTMNAISVDRDHWREQGVPPAFGVPAQRLADAYVRMGCRATFTCSPYLLDEAPQEDEVIAWSESNAVIFANTVLGARTAKHPDFLDLCIAVTGRAPQSGVYLDANRRPQRIIEVTMPADPDDAFWPLLGYLAGRAASDCIPLLRGVAEARPSRDDLKAMCAAFGTTSAAPMFHIEGITPEADGVFDEPVEVVQIGIRDMAAGWSLLNEGPEEIDLVAIGSPHASVTECRKLADTLDLALGAGRRRHPEVEVMVTAGRAVIGELRAEGTLARLQAAGVRVLPDLCWCSISEPVLPSRTRAVMTNSGKYAHYGPGLAGRPVRFGSLAACVEAAMSGHVEKSLPPWLADGLTTEITTV
ncbi:cis-3-hydroxy-L-proline dehydratase [Acetobacter conturbans]|uniref:DUF521 domain-containing protein n=1 Tax=Acetobacter conturbans TaxID=1737472 RepID=A0ABX0K352_9PROT|nr:aconitase X [Acetobacter conturbans]NHN89098.1 DUF521 domain-containing protein [Acetobacter conturbans]